MLVYERDTDVASSMNIQAVDCLEDHRAALCYREVALLIKTHNIESGLTENWINEIYNSVGVVITCGLMTQLFMSVIS